MPTIDRRSYFAEYEGKIYSFSSVIQRKAAIEIEFKPLTCDYMYKPLTCDYMYKHRPPYIIIPYEHCNFILKQIKERDSDHE